MPYREAQSRSANGHENWLWIGKGAGIEYQRFRAASPSTAPINRELNLSVTGAPALPVLHELTASQLWRRKHHGPCSKVHLAWALVDTRRALQGVATGVAAKAKSHHDGAFGPLLTRAELCKSRAAQGHDRPHELLGEDVVTHERPCVWRAVTNSKSRDGQLALLLKLSRNGGEVLPIQGDVNFDLQNFGITLPTQRGEHLVHIDISHDHLLADWNRSSGHVVLVLLPSFRVLRFCCSFRQWWLLRANQLRGGTVSATITGQTDAELRPVRQALAVASDAHHALWLVHRAALRLWLTSHQLARLCIVIINVVTRVRPAVHRDLDKHDPDRLAGGHDALDAARRGVKPTANLLDAPWVASPAARLGTRVTAD
mmetsp:Transcript_24361/g.68867  ORF Transcript_24361/g.68867 Transcript_24361/m.68867 type:complete len:371 (-) Transcript_24361:1795-2907(-)